MPTFNSFIASRRDFLVRSGGGAIALAAPLVLTPRRARAQSAGWMSQWNPGALDQTAVGNATSEFQTLYTEACAGPVTSGMLIQPRNAYNALAASLGAAGFHGASVSYLTGGQVAAGDPNALYNAWTGQGAAIALQDIANVLQYDGNPGNVAPTIMPPIGSYGLPNCHSYTAACLGASGSGANARRYRLGPQERPVVPPPESGGGDVLCGWLNWAGGYLSIMSIPLSVEGAACPPLGLAIGVIAVAMWVVSMAGGC